MHHFPFFFHHSAHPLHYAAFIVAPLTPVHFPPYTPFALMKRDGPRHKSDRNLKTSSDRNAAAFEQVYRNHVDQIYRLAQRLCGQVDAKDLVQETFLNAYRGLKDFRGEAQISTWLYRIAARACMQMRRKRKGEPDRELSLEEFIPTSEDEFRL
ncbi:MAG: hypothetical protein C4294_10710, partial [Nitrospiraceae bacterium]